MHLYREFLGFPTNIACYTLCWNIIHKLKHILIKHYLGINIIRVYLSLAATMYLVLVELMVNPNLFVSLFRGLYAFSEALR